MTVMALISMMTMRCDSPLIILVVDGVLAAGGGHNLGNGCAQDGDGGDDLGKDTDPLAQEETNDIMILGDRAAPLIAVGVFAVVPDATQKSTCTDHHACSIHFALLLIKPGAAHQTVSAAS